MLAGSIANAKLINSTITIAGNSIALGSSINANTLRQSLEFANHVIQVNGTAAGTYNGDTSVTLNLKNGNGINIVNTDGAITFAHSNSVTAKTTYGSTTTTASANGGSITVTDIKYDAQGHITDSTDRTITLSQTTYTLAGLMGDTAKGSATVPIYWTGSAWATITSYSGKASTAGTADKVANALSINGKTYDGSAAINVGVIGAAYGGSGKTTLEDSANVFLNALSKEASVPVDADYYIAQYVGGGTTTTTYHRRPVSALYNYIKSKTDVLYSAVGHTHNYAAASHTHTWSQISDRTTCTINTSGTITGSKVYGAVWNDYAEFRIAAEQVTSGQVVYSDNRGELHKTIERLQAFEGVVSDTFGFAIGENDRAKTPLAVAGRVLVYPDENKYTFHAGDAVCAGKFGTVSKMTREEIIAYPDRIVGIVSEIPEYETWGSGSVPVYNRIWIRVK